MFNKERRIKIHNNWEFHIIFRIKTMERIMDKIWQLVTEEKYLSFKITMMSNIKISILISKKIKNKILG